MYKGLEISKEEYEAQLQSFPRQHGPNQGNGFFGAWAWASIMEDEFKRQMRKFCGHAVVLIATLAATPAFAIKCENGYQRVQGNLIATPYCQDQLLAQVASSRGFKTSAAKIRNNPNHKKEICRFVFSDIRVQETCLSAGVPEYRGGR
jgi:hypothetical protein